MEGQEVQGLEHWTLGVFLGNTDTHTPYAHTQVMGGQFLQPPVVSTRNGRVFLDEIISDEVPLDQAGPLSH